MVCAYCGLAALRAAAVHAAAARQRPCPPNSATVCAAGDCRSSGAWCSRCPASRRGGTARPGPAPPGGCAASAGECWHAGRRAAAAALPLQPLGFCPTFRPSVVAKDLAPGVGPPSTPSRQRDVCPTGPGPCQQAASPSLPFSPSFGCEEMNECPVPMPFTPLGDFIHEVGRQGLGWALGAV